MTISLNIIILVEVISVQGKLKSDGNEISVTLLMLREAEIARRQ